MPDFTSEEIIEIVHKLERADLRRIYLGGANLYLARLNAANLTIVGLSGANLQHADLREAILVNTSFHQADLRWADLTGIKVVLHVRGWRGKMHSYHFTYKDDPKMYHTADDWRAHKQSFHEAIYNKKTKFPDEFDPEHAKMVLKE